MTRATAGSVVTGASGALRRALPYFVAAAVYVIGGGLLAAATAYMTTQKTAWATAYIVLVGGVATAVLGAALGWLAPRAGIRSTRIAFVLWNLGNIAVLAGQLGAVTPVTFVGGALLAVALVMIVLATRRDSAPAHPVLLWSFRGLVILLAVTIPIGLVLAALGH